MEYRYRFPGHDSSQGLRVGEIGMGFNQAVELLSRMRNRDFTVTVVLPDDDKDAATFDISRHVDLIAPVFCNGLAVENLGDQTRTLIEVVKGTVEYPIVVKAPVGHGVDGESGSTLFTKTQVKLALTSTIAWLRATSSWVATKWIQAQAAKEHLVSPRNVHLPGTDQRIKSLLKKAWVKGVGWRFESAPDLGSSAVEDEAKNRAKGLVKRWEEQEIERICMNLTTGILSCFYSNSNKQKKEDTTLDKLVLEYESRVSANQSS